MKKSFTLIAAMLLFIAFIPSKTFADGTISTDSIENAISYAYNEKSTRPDYWKGYCAAFVWSCYHNGAGLSNSSFATAREMGDALITHTDANPPRGALVFWYKTANPYGHAGHVGLSLGDGTVIHAYSSIKVSKISTVNNGGYTYRGWGSPISGYTLATESTPTELTLSGAVYPSGHYDSLSNFGLRGLFRSPGIITEVNARIATQSGAVHMSYSTAWNSSTYDIQTDGLNNQFTFRDLPDGFYQYYVEAKDSYGKTSSVSSWFSIGTVTYTIRYDANGGTGAPVNQIKEHDIALVLSADVPTRQGYHFCGWTTDDSGETIRYQPGDRYLENANHTLIACWSKDTVEYSGTCGHDLVWVLNENGNLTISGTGPMDNYGGSNPAPWDEYTIKNVTVNEGVTTIGDCAFYQIQTIEIVHLPESLVSIGYDAFWSCTKLRNINIPAAVREIGFAAFCNDHNITEIILPDGLTRIEEGTFGGCSFKSIVIPDSVNFIGQTAFSDCDDLEIIVLPEGVERIYMSTFSNCSSLREITIPHSVTEIIHHAFYNCYSLSKVNYSGLPEKKVLIEIGEGNSWLTSAVWNYIPARHEYESSIAINEDNFPDLAFRTYISENYDVNKDRFLSNREIAAVTYISLPGEYENRGSVKSLIGIEHFTELVGLSCGFNQLETLNVNGCIALQNLWCYGNQINSLYVADCSNLIELACWENQLTNLNISQNPKLEMLECANNQLYNLNLGNNPVLRNLVCVGNQISELDIRNNPRLVALVQDGLLSLGGVIQYGGHEGGWSSGESVLQYNRGVKLITGLLPDGTGILIDEISFPDTAFRNYVETNYDIDGNSELSSAEIAAVTEINVASYSSQVEPGPITSLKGIEYFTALKTLNCINNQLTELDVSKNTLLETLQCGWSVANIYFGNQLTSLDLSSNPELTTLWCDNNQLAKLDISKNTKLTTLMCSRNKLADLDISNNNELYWLYCWGNQLTELNVDNNTKLALFSCAQNQLTELDISHNPGLVELYCNNNQLTELDVSGCAGLQHLSCSNNQLTVLNITGCVGITNLYCSWNQLNEIDISRCAEMQSFECGANPLSSLNLSNNTSLTHLGCFENQLTELDLSNNTALQEMWCYSNQLNNLNLDNCPELYFLSCWNNQLTILNIRNNTALQRLFCYQNSLSSLDVSACPNLVQLATNVVPTAENGTLRYADQESGYYLMIDDGILLISSFDALEPDFVLPAALTTIEDEAFVGGAFIYVRLPDNAVSIGWHAFADCPNLAYIYIPALTTQIDEAAFGDLQGLTILGKAGSTAEAYAQNHHFNFTAVP